MKLYIIYIGYLAVCFVVVYIQYCIFVAPRERMKQQEAAMKASSEPQEGVWPPPPSTFLKPPKPEIWIFCMDCQRASKFADIAEAGGVCAYADCTGDGQNLVAWVDIAARISELPPLPETGTVYANLIHEAKFADISQQELWQNWR